MPRTNRSERMARRPTLRPRVWRTQTNEMKNKNNLMLSILFRDISIFNEGLAKRTPAVRWISILTHCTWCQGRQKQELMYAKSRTEKGQPNILWLTCYKGESMLYCEKSSFKVPGMSWNTWHASGLNVPSNVQLWSIIGSSPGLMSQRVKPIGAGRTHPPNQLGASDCPIIQAIVRDSTDSRVLQ